MSDTSGTQTSITTAIATLNPLQEALENAYWECSDIATKDRVFALISCVHSELSELAKLSVNDFSLTYECITPEFAGSCSKIQGLNRDIDICFHRTTTALKLKETLGEAANLLQHCKI